MSIAQAPETWLEAAGHPSFKEALERSRAELWAMPEEEVNWEPKVGVTEAHALATAAARRLEPYRGALLALCGPRAAPVLDSLPTAAAAAKQADIELLEAGAGSPIPGLRARGRRQHRLLFCDAQSLANRGHLDEEALERARAGAGDAGLVDGLLALVTLLRGAWPRIEGKSPLGAHEVDEAERIARLLSEAIAARDAGAPTAAAAELRARALTRLVNVYGEIRRMVEYLRYHEGDADVLAPSMHARRKRRQRAEETHERGAVLPVATDAEPEDDDAVTGVVRRASGPEEDSGAGPGAMRAATDAVEKRQRAPEVAEEAARASRPGGNGLVR